MKRLGGKNSTARTAEQSEIARYWYEGSPQGLEPHRACRGGAARARPVGHCAAAGLVNAAIADGFIAGVDTRYLYNFWRPVTAIRAGDTDGNDATTADPAWETFLNTPPLPDYPSTHSVAGGAAATVLARFFGSDQVAFTMTSGRAVRGDHAVVQQLLAGRPGERRLARLRRHPLPLRLPGRDQAGRTDRPARVRPLPAALSKVKIWPSKGSRDPNAFRDFEHDDSEVVSNGYERHFARLTNQQNELLGCRSCCQGNAPT